MALREHSLQAIKEHKQSVRIQSSLIRPLEKKALDFFAKNQPGWMSSDIFTVIGFLGAVMIGVGYILTNYNPAWLWLSTAGLIVNWYGDSLDGTYARIHHQQRPVYGYFLDHNMDGINEFVMFVGAGLSPILNTSIALLAYSAYILLSLYVSICAHVKNEFKISYGKLGPTEFRLIIALVNIFLFFKWDLVSEKIATIKIFSDTIQLGIFDFIAFGIFIILMIIFLVSFLVDCYQLGKADPLIKNRN